MKNLYFLLLLSFLLQKTNAQWVTIPDPNFVTFLQQNYPACMNGNQMDTTCSAIVNEILLDCSWSNIENLTGIEYFVNLDTLRCNNNFLWAGGIPNLPPNLVTLFCHDTYIYNLPNFPNSIKYLYIHNCWYANSIPQLPNNLIELTCYNNNGPFPSVITNLPTLPDSLKYLDCSNLPLNTLPVLPYNLTDLICKDNQLDSLPDLPNTLTYLNCNTNFISDLPTLPTTLNYLDCSNNSLNSLPTLPNILQTLIFNDNPNLNCLPFLSNNLSWIVFTNTGIQCIPNLINVVYSNPVLNTLPLCSSTINAQITAPSTSLCGVSSITLSADTGTGYSYQWQLNGNNISGATSQTYDATIAGDYSVIVSVNCALDTSNTITVTSGAAASAAITASGITSFCSGGSVTLDANTGTGLTYQWQLDGNNITGATSSSYNATATGNYSVMVSNNCGNSISNIITVNVTSAPGGAGTISGPTSFCRHTTQTFFVAAVSGATNYVWSVPPQATIISGAGSNSITVSFIVKQGDVSVKAANQCGAGPLTVLPVQVLKCANPNSSINSPLRNSGYSETFLYPNPASSEVTIQFNSTEENNYTIKLYDIHGRMVMTQNSIAVEGMNELKLDVKFLSKGIYFVEIFLDNDKVMKKLVVN